MTNMNIDSLANDILHSLVPQKVVKLRTKFVKAGKGRKHCPKCDTYMGVRTIVCECGYEFEQGVTKKTGVANNEEPAATEEERLYAMHIGAPGGRLIYVGSGSPSVSLTEINFNAVSDYCNFVVHEGITQGKIYTVQAIKHYLQHQFGYNSQEYRQLAFFVDRWYDYKMGADTPSSDGVEEEDGD